MFILRAVCDLDELADTIPICVPLLVAANMGRAIIIFFSRLVKASLCEWERSYCRPCTKNDSYDCVTSDAERV